MSTTDLSQFIKEAFGSNAGYVEGLLKRYQQDPASVDDSWQQYFGDLLNGRLNAPESSNGAAPEMTPVSEVKTRSIEPIEAKTSDKTPPPPLPSDASAKPITGPAKKIVENMEQSLTVPTATSFRNVPVKVLEENRRILNDHRSAQGHSKISFTHIIAWAIV